MANNTLYNNYNYYSITRSYIGELKFSKRVRERGGQTKHLPPLSNNNMRCTNFRRTLEL